MSNMLPLWIFTDLNKNRESKKIMSHKNQVQLVYNVHNNPSAQTPFLNLNLPYVRHHLPFRTTTHVLNPQKNDSQTSRLHMHAKQILDFN